jgi:hypothetical protein
MPEPIAECEACGADLFDSTDHDCPVLGTAVVARITTPPGSPDTLVSVRYPVSPETVVAGMKKQAEILRAKLETMNPINDQPGYDEMFTQLVRLDARIRDATGDVTEDA